MAAADIVPSAKNTGVEAPGWATPKPAFARDAAAITREAGFVLFQPRVSNPGSAACAIVRNLAPVVSRRDEARPAVIPFVARRQAVEQPAKAGFGPLLPRYQPRGEEAGDWPDPEPGAASRRLTRMWITFSTSAWTTPAASVSWMA